MSALLKVGEIARLTGKTVRAIRYYEELGLIQPDSHTKGGFRLYSPRVEEKVRLIEKFHELGFSLEDIAAVVRVYKDSVTGDDAAKQLIPLLRRTLSKIDQKMELLDSFRREIQTALRFVGGCVDCEEEPQVGQCATCGRGNRKNGVPKLIDFLVR